MSYLYCEHYIFVLQNQCTSTMSIKNSDSYKIGMFPLGLIDCYSSFIFWNKENNNNKTSN